MKSQGCILCRKRQVLSLSDLRVGILILEAAWQGLMSTEGYCEAMWAVRYKHVGNVRCDDTTHGSWKCDFRFLLIADHKSIVT